LHLLAFRYILVRLPVRDLINEFNFPDSEFRPVIRTDMLVDTIIPLCVMILTPLSVTSRPRTDEPSLGLAPTLITEVMRLIAEMRDRGLSVLLVEQNARAALRIADRGYVMEGGKITIEGTAEQLLSDERVRSAYLGGKSK